MKFQKPRLQDGVYMIGILLIDFLVNLFLVEQFDTQNMTATVFVLGVFLVSCRTQGYFWGILASMICVLAMNWAFTDPFWAFDLISPECISAALVMLIVASMTSALTTRLKKQEQLKAEAEKERMRGNLLRAISHDLRTPLTSICGACSAIIENYEEIPAEKQKRMLRDISVDAKWLTRMVENLLSVTRVDGGSMRLKKQETVLDELIDALLVKFQKHYPHQKVIIQMPEQVISVPMDAILIEQVLMNLLENAVFHAKGMEHLWLRIEAKGSRVHFCVEDDGCGIPEDRHARLFTGNLDSEAPTDSSRSSMGIGLSVCRTIIKAHGSDIYAKNRRGGGAAFYFSLETENTDHGEQQIQSPDY